MRAAPLTSPTGRFTPAEITDLRKETCRVRKIYFIISGNSFSLSLLLLGSLMIRSIASNDHGSTIIFLSRSVFSGGVINSPPPAAPLLFTPFIMGSQVVSSKQFFPLLFLQKFSKDSAQTTRPLYQRLWHPQLCIFCEISTRPTSLFQAAYIQTKGPLRLCNVA